MSRIVFLLLLIVCVVTVQCHIHHEEHGGNHKCIHDELHEREAKEINGVTQQMSKPARFEPHIEQMILKKRNIRSIHEDNIIPLRVDFRTDYLDKSNDLDQRTCYEVGQKYRKGNPSSPSITCSTTVKTNCWGACSSELVVTEEMKATMRNVLIPDIKETFQKLLSTRKLPGIASWTTSNCGAEGGVPIPSDLSSGVNPEVHDTVMFVTLRPTEVGVLGWAVSCKSESQYGRPIAGQLNISPMIFKSPKLLQLGVMLHETTHALGFSGSSFSSFIDEYGNPRANPTVVKTSTFTGSSGSSYSKSIYYLKTPEVVARAKTYLNCETTDAVPLEEKGGEGTAGSHFEKSFIMNELMVGSVGWFNPTESYAFSQFTLAVLQDSGWYLANFTHATPTLWGANMGCSFLEKRCENWETQQNVGYYCNTPFKSDGVTRVNYCTFNYRSKGYCDVVKYSSPLNYYEHLPNPTEGGSDDLLNYCPIVFRYEDGKCTNVDNRAITGEKYGLSSGCFDSNIALLGAKQNPVDARCFRYNCHSGGYLQVVIDAPTGDKIYDCPIDESYLRIENDAPIGMTGYVTCPKNGYTMLCKTPFVDPTVTSKFPNVGNSGGSNPLCDWFGIWCSPSNRVTYSMRVIAPVVIGALVLAH